MGKLIQNMTEQEIIAQRERAKRNYKPRPRISRKQKLINELQSIQNKLKSSNTKLGLQLAINTIEEF